MSVAARHSIISAPETSQTNFSDRLAALVSRIEYRRADSEAEREAIFRLRYQAYLREGAIAPNHSGRFTDADDEADNAFIFGLYIDGELASSLRLHIGNKDHPDFPSLHVFPDILQPRLDAGRVILDITRFVADERLSRLHRGLPYVSVRPTLLASEYFGVDDMLAAVRIEHQAFYQRAFGHQALCGARPYPQLSKPISLMSLDFPKASSGLYRRYPFFLSTRGEQQMVFERMPVPASRNDTQVRDRLSPFVQSDLGQLAG